jgi:3-oxoacyl-[acyl-carrier protein] reductase
MDLGIRGRKAVVCASSKGLGKACATALAEAGCEVVINGRDERVLEATAKEIVRETGAKVTTVAADVGTPDGRRALLGACPEPDILVNNNAGPPFKNFRELDHAALVKGVEGNMITPIELIQAVIDGMIARKFGRIINITSGSVKMPLPGLDLSSGARAGLTAFLAGVAREVAHANVTINHILPGAFETDRLRSNVKVASEKQGVDFDKLWKERAQGIPAKRYGNPEEFGQLCAFIASAHAGYITGQNFLIDGGMFQGAF